MTQPTAKLIAFYLPQYHPIPENDRWWGKGFTEWTNVARARRLFRGHDQPRLPADLGFYDLRVPETRAAQAELAKSHGIFGFCYWHYWFAGRRLLERPFTEVLNSGEPDFPFCLSWANQSWSGIWHGSADKILMEQTYPGDEDHQAHFHAVLDAFRDERYITIDQRPLFIVHYPADLPEQERFTDCWRELALKSGLPGLYLVGIAHSGWSPERHGFDASITDNPRELFDRLRTTVSAQAREVWAKLVKGQGQLLASELLGRLKIFLYADVIDQALSPQGDGRQPFPCVIPNWDNTPRSGRRGVVLHHSTPERYGEHLRQAIGQVTGRPAAEHIVFIKSWNEWAEGNFLEPDQQFGRAYLEATRREAFRQAGLS